MKKSLLAVIGLILIFVMAACSEDTSNKVETQDIKKMVQDFSGKDSNEEVTASITSEELIVTNSDNKEISYSLPEDEFFVPIAPFVEVTHPCTNHSLTGCQGELVEKKFDVYIEDEDGNVIVDEPMTSLKNGFIDFWLPRDKNYYVKIQYDGKTAESEISTFEGDNTCITTIQLI
ncbi:copper-binding protein CueP [Cytobacillus horneckiae]|uniref:CueP family metal-binding protein n=1 Tax=Cytobacillus horneckiae TaxID=549687 RepID=UPI0019D3035A|nr:CueP family metal-binding protein [Cytobacillus horneckiae]MBN6886002.1 CueP family metal-binding protein [Cytobacillus horneckiae]